MSEKCKLYEADVFIEARFETVIDQRAFIEHCDTRLQDTATWTNCLMNLLSELEAELDYLENTDML